MFINQILTKLKSLVYSKSETDSLLNGKASSSHTHTKSEISDFPTIPTVNNATLTIQKNGSNVATFTANASSNVTANISVPTNTNQLTNGAGFITSEIDSSGTGWVRFKSGLQICWGEKHAPSTSPHSLPKGFKDTSYVVMVIMATHSSDGTGYLTINDCLRINTRTTTTFSLDDGTGGLYILYLAIGNWK